MMADNAATLIANLRKLSDSVSAFQCCFAELHQHIDSIRSTIHSLLPGLAINTSTVLPASSQPAAVSPAPAIALAPEQFSKPEPSWESAPSEEEGGGGGGGRGGRGEEEEEEEEEEEMQSPRSEEVQSPHRSELKSSHLSELKSPHCSELENICKSKNGRDLRRYMVMRISDINRLLEEVPKALRLSRNPARLVLECMGKFYFQGSNSYTKGSHMVRGRKASVLVLECFLLMRIDGVEIEKGVKEEAEKAALAWRKRLIAEGGIGKAYEMDARVCYC